MTIWATWSTKHYKNGGRSAARLKIAALSLVRKVLLLWRHFYLLSHWSERSQLLWRTEFESTLSEFELPECETNLLFKDTNQRPRIASRGSRDIIGALWVDTRSEMVTPPSLLEVYRCSINSFTGTSESSCFIILIFSWWNLNIFMMERSCCFRLWSVIIFVLHVQSSLDLPCLYFPCL